MTIQNELLRSMQEVEIANNLYLNNIGYQYEVVYPYYLKGSLKPYTPDFLLKQGDFEVYLEHFGITESSENFLYSKEQVEYYKRAVNQKILHHREHGTKLIYAFSAYNDNISLLNYLKEELTKCGFGLCPKNNEEVLKKIIATAEKFDQMWNATENVRNWFPVHYFR